MHTHKLSVSTVFAALLWQPCELNTFAAELSLSFPPSLHNPVASWPDCTTFPPPPLTTVLAEVFGNLQGGTKSADT